LLSHRISDTVTVDENVCWHLSVVEFTVGLERSLEIVTEYSWRYNFLSFLWLRW
jgi:hypothetical protein